MLAVIPLLAVVHGGAGARRPSSGRRPVRPVLPLFVVGFAALALVRTLGDVAASDSSGLLDAAHWTAVTELASAASTACLAVAMAAIGLSTSLAGLRRLGRTPLLAGLATALAVGLVSAALVHGVARRLLDTL